MKRTFNRPLAPRAPLAAVIAGLALVALEARQQQPPQQPTDVSTTITSGAVGTPPRYAVPEFLALTKDTETVDAAKTIARVLWDDLNFEHEFALIPRDILATVPAAASLEDVPFDRWREINADGVIIGTVQKTDTGVQVRVRLYNVRNQASAFGREYTGSIANPRVYAHQMADEIHQNQRALQGVARTKLTFNSDRSNERIVGTIEQRSVKEVMICDYDGENQRAVTANRSLNISSVWAPDARSIVYTSYRRGAPGIYVANIYEGTGDELTKGSQGQSMLPAVSPDGTRIAFASTREGNGNFDIYVMNRDGSNVRRLTTNPAADVSPTWSPSGTQIAFTSDRLGTGSPEVFIMDADGLNQRQLTHEGYADRPTWSPAPYNEIAYTARTGPGNDIKIIDVASREVRRITFGEGTNESPAFSPNGRHLAFMSTRNGKSQIFTVARDGRDLKQLTRAGNNQQPNWSPR
jgi:TolB protein